MKVIDAFWELRNLGVTTQEVEVDEDDGIQDIRSALSSLTAQYQVVKVPALRLDINQLLSESDFFLAEASIRVSHDLKEISCPKLIKRMSDSLTFDVMNEEELSIMREQIGKGMFQTDRIVLDPFFSKEQAENRYIMWMNDEAERGSQLYNYKFKGQPVGFSCMKKVGEDSYYPVLGGVYLLDRPLPIGSAIVHKQLEMARSLGGKELFTYISSNNPAVVRVYSQLGYTFEEVRYVFVKHA